MDDYALVLHQGKSNETALADHHVEPIAEHNFARKKLVVLEQGIDRLRRDARQQNEIVSQLGGNMKSMVTELDLRRAIGLAFQEFEVRLEDVFQDSNRKCLAMFSKREEVSELQALITKKVNWAEYNAVLRKLSDLRQYIDTMAESVFIGHRDALNSEFAKKADASTVEQALKEKADFCEVSEVRARLERLEVLVAHMDTRHSGQLDEVKNDVMEQSRIFSEKHREVVQEQKAVLLALQDEHNVFASRLHGAEGALAALSETATRMMDAERVLRGQQENCIQTIEAMQEQLARVDEAAKSSQEDLERLAREAKGFREDCTQKFMTLSMQADTCKEKLDFLTQATEMMKRKSREAGKSNTSKFEEVSEEQDRHSNQLSALEKQLKKQERELRTLVQRSRPEETSTLCPQALPLPGIGETPADDAPNERLKMVLDQLEKIAAGGHPFEQLGVDVDPKRPPLPWPGDDRRGADSLAALRGIAGPSGQTSIDSARSCPPYQSTSPSSATRGMYNQSPRLVPGNASSFKAPRKKR